MEPLVEPAASLTEEEVRRYSRHLIIPEVGMLGQRRLRNARVLVVGAGGLGSPALLYLAAAGVGTLGVVDFDVVEESNLQRQVVHGVADVGRAKVDSAADRVAEVNPLVCVQRHREPLTASNAMEVVAGYDLVVDGADNFATRYLVNDACALLGKPYVWGSIFRFDGQVSVFWAGHGPCYRCVYPEPPPPGMVPSCAEGGVLGVLCGSVGSAQVAEAIKIITGVGTPLLGRLQVHDALTASWRTLAVAADPDCALCGEHPSVTELVDYAQFCGTPAPGIEESGGDQDQLPEVSATELRGLLERRADGDEVFTLVDVREPHEREINTVPGAVSIPKPDIDDGSAQLPEGRLVLHCKSGGRSAAVLRDLVAGGRRDVVHLAGGVDAWVRDVDPGQPRY